MSRDAIKTVSVTFSTVLAFGVLFFGLQNQGHTLAAAANQDQAEKVQPDSEKANPEEQIQTLMKDRVTILRTMVEATRKIQEGGGTTADAVSRMQVRALKAELDLAQTDSERVAIHEKIVAELQTIEDSFVRSAKLTSVFLDLQEARLNRMDAQIELNKVKSRLAQAEK